MARRPRPRLELPSRHPQRGHSRPRLPPAAAVRRRVAPGGVHRAQPARPPAVARRTHGARVGPGVPPAPRRARDAPPRRDGALLPALVDPWTAQGECTPDRRRDHLAQHRRSMAPQPARARELGLVDRDRSHLGPALRLARPAAHRGALRAGLLPLAAARRAAGRGGCRMSRRAFDHALIVGKFFPPHVGHEYLVRTALRFSRRVTVLVLAASNEPLPMELRARWLRECFPETDDLHVVAALDDVPIDYDDETIWRAHVDVMRRALSNDASAHDEPERPVDVVFSSEEYGETLARWFGARHVCLDRARALYPISATAIRQDLDTHWLALPAPVRAGLAL